MCALQCRDYQAAIQSGDPDRWTTMQRLISHAYVVLQLFKIRDYGNAILLTKLQMHYLEEVGHPALAAVKHEQTLINEVQGECGLGVLAGAMKNQNMKSEIDVLNKTWLLEAAHQTISHQSLANLGMPQGGRTHCVVHIHRKKEVLKAKGFLHVLGAQVRTHALLCFVHDDGDSAEKTASKSSSDDGDDGDGGAARALRNMRREEREDRRLARRNQADDGGGSDESDEAGDEGPAHKTVTRKGAKYRIEKGAELKAAEVTVWLTEEKLADIKPVEQLNKLRNNLKDNRRYQNL
jgi:hypothetical protein